MKKPFVTSATHTADAEVPRSANDAELHLLQVRERVIRELLECPHMGRLLQDPYANYVIQSALMVTQGPLHAAVVDAIRPHINQLRSTPHGKRIISKINVKI